MQIIEKTENYDPIDIEKHCAKMKLELGLVRVQKQRSLTRRIGNTCFFSSFGIVVWCLDSLVKQIDVFRFLLFIAAFAVFTLTMTTVLEWHERLLGQENDLKRRLQTPAMVYHETVKNAQVVVCFGRIMPKNSFEVTLITRQKGKWKHLEEHKIIFSCDCTAQDSELILDVGNEIVRCSKDK